jgi:glycosyltransferase involved in cell wall biosynthesis
MRILFIFGSSGVGGAEKSMLRLMSNSSNNEFESYVIFYGKKNKEMANQLDNINIYWKMVNYFSVNKIISQVRLFSPDIIYIFSPVRTLLITYILRLLFIDAVLVRAERSSLDRFIDIIVRHLDKYSCDAYIANSRTASLKLKNKIKIDNKKIFTVYNGIEFDNQTLNLKSPDNKISLYHIICVANINQAKGHIILLRAIKNLHDNYPKLRALLLGEDQTSGKFFEIVKSEGLQNTFVWLGYVNDVGKYLVKSEIFVLPSLKREGMPTSILEAMLFGVPIIATRVGGVEELVEDGKTGILIEPNNCIELAENIKYLIEHDAVRIEMGRNARNFVLKERSIQQMFDNHYKIFSKLIEKKNSV